MAFCSKHCQVAEERGIPTKLKDFLKFCGLRGERCYTDGGCACQTLYIYIYME